MAKFKSLLSILFLSLPIGVCAAAANPPNETMAEFEAQQTEFTISVKSAQAGQYFSGSIFVDNKVIKVEERTPYELKLNARSVRFILSTDVSLPPVTFKLARENSLGSETTGHAAYNCSESKLSQKVHLERYGASVCNSLISG